METVTTVADLRKCVRRMRTQAGRIAFVPTMGNLHAGHLQLVRHARAIADHVIVSVFVNPLQFGDDEDYTRYPVTRELDQSALMDADADLLFMPSVSTIYPDGAACATKVVVTGLNSILEGEFRPTHFDGVTTVVAKLFNMVEPDIAVFGEKDYQQLLIIRRMVSDLDLPVAIEGVATVRETDGLAMSSRNGYLTAEERTLAPQLYRSLLGVRDKLQCGDRDLAGIEQAAMGQLREAGFVPQYVSIRRRIDLAVPAGQLGELVVLGAAMLGSTHLIDNISVSNS